MSDPAAIGSEVTTEHLVRDGVRLAFERCGSGGREVLLVHGMRCDRRHMRPLQHHLGRSHTVVNVDLRGHGESDAPAEGYSNAEIVGDLLAVVDAVGFERPVLIGHSFGGSVSLHAAATVPERIGGLVLLDSGVRTAEEKRAEMGAMMADPDPDAARRFFTERLFSADDDPTVRDEILAVMDATPAHAVDQLAANVLGFDAYTAALECTVPSLFVLADRPFTTDAVLSNLGPSWRIGRVVGAGHFVQLFATAQVTAMIDRFLDLTSHVTSPSRRHTSTRAS